jgi:hypothetical protein
VKVKGGKDFSVMKGALADKKGKGGSDGVRCDVEGNVWASAGWIGDGFDGVHVFSPEGQRIGFIKLPETASNLCFGGPKRNRLFITASQSLVLDLREHTWCASNSRAEAGHESTRGRCQHATAVCVCSPRPSTPSSMTSPGFMNRGSGLKPRPTPGGVPVLMMSPGKRLMNWLM